MRYQRQYGIVFFIGAVGYSIMEVAFRGYTHWTMLLTGGFCFLLLYIINRKMESAVLWKKCLVGTLVVSGVEFAVGCIVNLWLEWNVWDYSLFRFQILGQVSLLFSAIWFFLCIPICFLSEKMRESFR